MFGEVRGAATAITGNTFTPVTLLWMGRVKRGGKSSQVHRKVMIQTVYNRISPPISRPLSFPLLLPLFHLDTYFLSPSLPPSTILTGPRWFPAQRANFYDAWYSCTPCAKKKKKWSDKDRRGWVSKRVSHLNILVSPFFHFPATSLPRFFARFWFVWQSLNTNFIRLFFLFFLFHFIFYAIGGNCNQDISPLCSSLPFNLRYVLFFR